MLVRTVIILFVVLCTQSRMMAADKPECIVTLSKADRFYGPTPGEAGPSAVQKAYAEATAKVGTMETADLQWLLKSGSPAGRLYGAVLLWQSSRVGANLSLDLLKNDNAALQYQNGCKVTGATVKEIAESLKEKGSFLNFQLGSMFCKLKAPVESESAEKK